MTLQVSPLSCVIGRVIRRARLEQRRTLADVSGAAELSREYYRSLECGSREWYVATIARVSIALGMEASALWLTAERELVADAWASVEVTMRATPWVFLRPLFPQPVAASGEACPGCRYAPSHPQAPREVTSPMSDETEVQATPETHDEPEAQTPPELTKINELP